MPPNTAKPVVSPTFETSAPNPQVGKGGTVYNDMTPNAKALIIGTRVLSILATAGTFIASIGGMLPANLQPYSVLVVGLIPGVEWLIRKVCDWMDNGKFDESFQG